MSRDIEFISDVFYAMRAYTSKSELQPMAEDLVRIFDDHGMSDGFEDDDTLTGNLKKAIKIHFDLDDGSSEDGDKWGEPNDD